MLINNEHTSHTCTRFLNIICDCFCCILTKRQHWSLVRENKRILISNLKFFTKKKENVFSFVEFHFEIKKKKLKKQQKWKLFLFSSACYWNASQQWKLLYSNPVIFYFYFFKRVLSFSGLTFWKVLKRNFYWTRLYSVDKLFN